MAKLDRKDIKIFGENDASNEIVQFGSTRAGTANPSTDPDILQGLTNYGQGWREGVVASTNVPPFTEFNALQYLVSRELAYLQQAGFPEYSATTAYYIGKSIVREPEGTKLYISLTDDNVGNPLTDPINWQLLTDLSGDTLVNLNVLNKVNFAVQPAVEISGGSVVYTGQSMVLDTEGLTSTDTLLTITGGVTGDEVEIRSNSASRDITIRSGAGTDELFIPNSVDVELTSSVDRLTFVKRDAGYWSLKSSVLTRDSLVRTKDLIIENGFSTPRTFETISSGAINYVGAYIELASEVVSSPDTLTTINGGSDGDRVLLRTRSAGEPITVQDGGGNIQLKDSINCILNTQIASITLVNRAGTWIEECRAALSEGFSTSALREKPVTTNNSGGDIDHDIVFTSGSFQFAGSDGRGYLSSNITKRLDATWANGSGSGGRAAGVSPTSDTTYHCFVISDSSGTSVDAGFDTSVTASNLLADPNVIAAGYTKYKRVSSFITDGASNIIPGTYNFSNDGSYEFYYAASILESTDPVFTTTEKTIVLTMPSGIKLKPFLEIFIRGNSGAGGTEDINYYSTNTDFKTRFIARGGGSSFSHNIEPDLLINDRILRYVCSANTTSSEVNIRLNGWADNNLNT